MADFREVDQYQRFAIIGAGARQWMSLEQRACRFGEILSLSPGSAYVGISTGVMFAAVGSLQISECKALTAASWLSTGTNKFTECGDKTYLSAIIP